MTKQEVPLEMFDKVNRKTYDGVVFMTYSKLVQPARAKGRDSTLEMLVQWLGGENGQGVIVFDEVSGGLQLCTVLGQRLWSLCPW